MYLWALCDDPYSDVGGWPLTSLDPTLCSLTGES